MGLLPERWAGPNPADLDYPAAVRTDIMKWCRGAVTGYILGESEKK
jgi:hypothetical protein